MCYSTLREEPEGLREVRDRWKPTSATRDVQPGVPALCTRSAMMPGACRVISSSQVGWAAPAQCSEQEKGNKKWG